MLSEMSRFWRRLTNKLCCMRDDDEEVTEMVIGEPFGVQKNDVVVGALSIPLPHKSTHPTLAKEITAQARSNQRMQVKVGGGRSGRSNATEILDDVKMIVREGDDRQPQPLTKKHTLCQPGSTILL
ncbi:hypothetical protein VTO58DRAFT_104520 [Aureobasidium pullulans]